MKSKITLEELKQYILAEAQKLYKIAILKEEKENIEKTLAEWDVRAMKAAKKDIEKDGYTFEPLGKSKFEKHLKKKDLKKAMSPTAEKNEAAQVFTGTDVTNPNAKMYFFKIKHDKGTDKLKIADFSQENAKKVIAAYMNAPESAIEFVKEEPIQKIKQIPV